MMEWHKPGCGKLMCASYECSCDNNGLSSVKIENLRSVHKVSCKDCENIMVMYETQISLLHDQLEAAKKTIEKLEKDNDFYRRNYPEYRSKGMDSDGNRSSL